MLKTALFEVIQAVLFGTYLCGVAEDSYGRPGELVPQGVIGALRRRQTAAVRHKRLHLAWKQTGRRRTASPLADTRNQSISNEDILAHSSEHIR